MTKNMVGSFSLMKQLNTSLILSLIRQNTSISRAEIARLTGLSPATLTNIASELIAEGYIKEAPLRGTSNGGRRPIMLEMDKENYIILTICINESEVNLALADFNAHILTQTDIPFSNTSTSDSVIEQIISSSRSLLPKKKKLLGIGVALHGLVDSEKGNWVYATNYGWHDIPLCSLLKEAFQCPVFIDNHVRIMALGESWFGRAKPYNNFAVLHVGHGVGSAHYINGKIYRGSSQFAGEVGHTSISVDGPKCSCGNYGCLQAFASELAVEEKARGKSYKELVAAYNTGDEEAVSLISEQGKYLGIGIASLIQICNPESIILTGGDITMLGDNFLRTIQAEVSKHCIRAEQVNTPILYSSLGKISALRGAAAMVMDSVFETLGSTLG